MNINTVLFLFRKDVRAIACEYEDVKENPSRKLTVFKTFDRSISTGDIVVVPTETRVGFTAVRVVEVDVTVDLDTKTPMNWIAGAINAKAFEVLKADEANFIARMRKVQENAEREKLRSAMMATPGMEEAIAALPGPKSAPMTVDGRNGEQER